MPLISCHYYRSKIIFSFLLIYACATCAVTCILLWNASTNTSSNSYMSTSSGKLQENSLVYFCANNSAGNSGNCDSLEGLQLGTYISSGWTKVVHRSLYNGENVAVKSVNFKGKHLIECSKLKSFIECHNEAVDTLSSEVHNLQKLFHPNIIKLKAHCISSEPERKLDCLRKGIIVTELGDPVSNIKLLQLPWKHRFKLLYDLLNLLHYLAHWPVGPIALLDLRRTQFILTETNMKLTDVDNIRIGDPACNRDDDCTSETGGTRIDVNCTEGRCLGYNERFNLVKAFLEFGPYLLIGSDVPPSARALLDDMRAKSTMSNSTTNELMNLVTKLNAY